MRLTVIVGARAGSGRLFALLEPFTRSPEFVVENHVWEKSSLPASLSTEAGYSLEYSVGYSNKKYMEIFLNKFPQRNFL